MSHCVWWQLEPAYRDSSRYKYYIMQNERYNNIVITRARSRKLMKLNVRYQQGYRPDKKKKMSYVPWLYKC